MADLRVSTAIELVSGIIARLLVWSGVDVIICCVFSVRKTKIPC
jgi:hypothetical protein